MYTFFFKLVYMEQNDFSSTIKTHNSSKHNTITSFLKKLYPINPTLPMNNIHENKQT